MTTIAITGANGLLGWHASVAAQFKHGFSVRRDTRAMWGDPDAIRTLLDGADHIFHFAALNRAPDEDVVRDNTAITDTLIVALDQAAKKPRTLTLSNSTHIARDTAYGAMKRDVSRRLGETCERLGISFIDAVMPNVFGECGKPFSNSAVHTFCHQLAQGETPRVDSDASITLVHAGDALDVLFAEISAGTAACSRRIDLQGTDIKVPALLDRLSALHGRYTSGIFPDVSNAFDLRLFNTLRSFMLETHYPIPLTLRTDNRGALAECIKSDGGGQIFYSSTHPEITRGNHFHFGKVERFVVVEGDAIIRIRRVLGDRVHEFAVSGREPVAIDMPTLHTHNITNSGSTPLITLFWTHEHFDPERPDTYAETV